jgi:hypothetical protein
MRPDRWLDPTVDFERYRTAVRKQFIAIAQRGGHHAFHDLDELAEDFYNDFWTEWLERDRREELTGPAVPYIAGAMLNKLRDLSRRGHSVRAPQLVQSESEAILASIAVEDLDPAKRAVFYEQLGLCCEIVQSLPMRERVAFGAVAGRDSRKKGTPLAGYRLAAAQLGISEIRAKKLSLKANRRIRLAVEQIESGTWCERWRRSIELVAAGEESEAGFCPHAERCVACRKSVARLRSQATPRGSG